MIAVADTSPLCYLVLTGEIELLPRLFARVVTPRVVVSELLHPDAPAQVRYWAAHVPSWLAVEETPDIVSPGTEKLQAGERAVVFLAETLGADILLIDEKAARLVAAQRGLAVTGTLGVLGEAATRDMVDLAGAIDRLRQNTFRCSPALLKATLERYGSSR
jgi:predicted nucleic acid-binding protein